MFKRRSRFELHEEFLIPKKGANLSKLPKK